MSGIHAKPKDHTRIKQMAAAASAMAVGGSAVAVLAAPAAMAGTVPSSSPWSCILLHESGDRNLSYGDGTSTGYLQIIQSTWDAYGGQAYGSQAYKATEAQQFKVAYRILAAQGPGAWTTNSAFGCGLTRSTPNPFAYVPPVVVPPVVTPPVVTPPVVDPPDPTPAPPPVRTGRHYVVVKGDWLAKIAHAHGLSSWHSIYDIPSNRAVIGSNPDLILPGQVLLMPA